MQHVSTQAPAHLESSRWPSPPLAAVRAAAGPAAAAAASRHCPAAPALGAPAAPPRQPPAACGGGAQCHADGEGARVLIQHETSLLAVLHPLVGIECSLIAFRFAQARTDATIAPNELTCTPRPLLPLRPRRWPPPSVPPVGRGVGALSQPWKRKRDAAAKTTRPSDGQKQSLARPVAVDSCVQGTIYTYLSPLVVSDLLFCLYDVDVV